MKKSYKIEVDCANCANKMELAAKKTPGDSSFREAPSGRPKDRIRILPGSSGV